MEDGEGYVRGIDYTHGLHPAQSGAAIEAAAPHCRALNARIFEGAATSGHGSALASPVTGAGIFTVRREMLFLRAIALGKTGEDEWASHALECVKDDCDAGSLSLAGLQSDARAFARIRLPVLRALRVA